MNVEINVHRIGGVSGPRLWRHEFCQVSTQGPNQFSLDANSSPALWMHVRLDSWTPAGLVDFLTCRAQLIGINGENLGVRTAYPYSKPHDIPTYTSYERIPDQGLYVLSRRVVSE